MFHLIKDDIHLNECANNKTDAIKKIAAALTSAGFVGEGYVDGMLERESQASTYLGIGIAIPHGTPKTRHLVKKTGVQVFCFPDGVVWGDDGEKAYVAIGIAASSNEHLELLRQLTHVLSADGMEEKIKHIRTADEAVALLTGKETSDGDKLSITQSSLLLDIPADDLATLQALNASRLKQQNAVNNAFIEAVLSSKPNYLGGGVWINDSQNGNLKNALAFSRTNNTIDDNGKTVKALITISSIDNATTDVINRIADLAFNQQLDKLLSANSDQLIALFTGSQDSSIPTDNSTPEDIAPEDTPPEEVSAEFVIENENGLHTRPSSVLVKLAKEFNSKITIANLDRTAADGSFPSASATSLMKIVALGAKKGTHLRFTAVGEDAADAIDAIGKAIKSGLGEGKE
ncbi:fused PTS fructose transporter subunit IIA/HPr protein [Orbaceae bacterium ESL0721]|nr:fused PTS fructose transporter subunit IIA/HPr protein [Orbaceae bacterium ESL0721]